MNKNFLFKVLFFVAIAFNARSAEVDIYKIFDGLTNIFDSLSAEKKGLLSQVDEALLNASKFKAFSNCQARALSSDKPYRLLVQVIRKPGKPDIKVYCADYTIPLEAIKFMLELIKNKIIGTNEDPGLFSSVIQILEGAGIQEIQEIKAAVKEIQILLKAFEDILTWLIKSLKVDPNAKANVNIPETSESNQGKEQGKTDSKPTVKVKNFYEVLELSPTATVAEVKRAYRSLALKYHPDKNTDDPEAEEKFKAIAEAYATLADPETKKAYDAALKGAK